MIEPRIEIIAVSKNYLSKCVFKNINVSFFPGEIIGLTGKNGSGKTTLVKMLCGLIAPDAGAILIDSLNISQDKRKIMKTMGVLLDGSRSLYWRLSAWENYRYFAGLKGIFGTTVQTLGQELMQLFDLWDVKHQPVESFSLGMKQKLSLCCALCHNPTTIILDEPTIAIDAASKICMKRLLEKLSQDGKTVIITSHENEMLQEICTRHVIISNTDLLVLT